MEGKETGALSLLSLLAPGKISRDFVATFAARMAVAICGTIAGVLLARILGAKEYGVFAFYYSAALIALIFTKLGLDGSAVKFVAEYVASNDPARLMGFIRCGRKSLYYASVVVIIVILSLFLTGILPSDRFLLVLATVPTFVLLAQVHFDQAALNGFQKTAFSPLPEGAIRAVIVSLLLLLWWVLPLPALSAPVALLCNGLALGIALVVARSYSRTVMRRYVSENVEPIYQTRLWLHDSLYYLLITCAHIILTQTDIIMLGVVVQQELVGYYAAAVQISTLLLFFQSATNPVIMPRLAAAYTRGDMEALRKDARLGTTLTFLLSFPLFLCMLIFREELIFLLFGEDYLPAAPVLGILLIAQLFKVISAPTGYVMTMTGNERITSWVIGGAAVLNVILNVLLVPKYGLMGAGIATCISALCWNALLVLKVRRLFGVLLIPFLPERQR